MKLFLGLYTELYSTPPSLFDKTLSLVYEPVLSFMYNNPGHILSLYQSSAMMKHIQRERPEYRSLVSTLCKRGEINPLTGTWSQSILSLLPPKDRVTQIERMTSFIRHEYGVLPNTAFFYGQVWQPLYISLLKNAGIDNVVISTWKGGDKEAIDQPFLMNELGKKVRIFPFHDRIASSVESYSKGDIGYDRLREEVFSSLDGTEGEKTVFLNMDQLVLGSQREGKGAKPGLLVVDILSRAETLPISSFNVTEAGYLPQGWYGRDSETFSLSSFNELFVYDEESRYRYNRFINLAEGTISRNNRLLRKDVSTALFNVSAGPLFIHDSQLAPLRYRTRRNFWESIIGAENCFWEYTEGPSLREWDWEDISRPDIVMSNRTYLAVVSPKGAACPEFDFLLKNLNIFDTSSPLDRNIPIKELKKSFSDIVEVNGREWSSSSSMFFPEVLDKKRSEVQFLLEEDDLPFTLSKRYRMRASTFILDILLTNVSSSPLKGTYSVVVYLSMPDVCILGSDQRMDMVTKGEVRAKTVKYSSRMEDETQMIFSSTSLFTLTEEIQRSTETTALGEEEFGLGKKIVFHFPLEVDGDESVTYRLVMRVQGPKKDQ